jgi:hypothetical protein
MYRHGRYTKRTKELGRLVRKMARAADVLNATLSQVVGLRPPRQLRRRVHVKRAFAAAKAKEATK